MLLETLSISQQVWCQGGKTPEWSWQRVVLQGGRRWSRAGGSLLCLPDPLSNQKVYGGFGRPAVGIRKKKAEENLAGGKRGEMRHPRYESVNAARPTISIPDRRLIPSLGAWSQISICGSNDPAPRPCGQSRSRPVIKMKWAADPMVPFRRVEHWPRDLYLIDQPVQREKSSFPPERPVPHSTALFQSKCLCEKRKNCFFKLPCLGTSCAGIIVKKRETTNLMRGADSNLLPD